MFIPLLVIVTFAALDARYFLVKRIDIHSIYLGGLYVVFFVTVYLRPQADQWSKIVVEFNGGNFTELRRKMVALGFQQSATFFRQRITHFFKIIPKDTKTYSEVHNTRAALYDAFGTFTYRIYNMQIEGQYDQQMRAEHLD